MHDTPSGRLQRATLYPRLICLVHWALGRRLVFLSQAERSQAGWAGKGRHVRVVPHYVEQRSVAPATARIDPSNLRLGVVGFIDSRKNPLFVLQVVRQLSGAELSFLGGDLLGQEDLTRRLETAIGRLGLNTRVRISGYLSEPELDAELGRIDIGLCLYGQASTSGSLSTLLAARRPIVASNLPIFREYATAAPRAITVVEMDPEVVAQAVLEVANRDPDWVAELEELAQSRSVRNFGRALWEAAGRDYSGRTH
jgi:glycosyltransferase involved in cell wall biosynthesis